MTCESKPINNVVVFVEQTLRFKMEPTDSMRRTATGAGAEQTVDKEAAMPIKIHRTRDSTVTR